MKKHLGILMDGLNANVFRTYNASHKLQKKLEELTSIKDSVAAKLLTYNRANREVAFFCNRQGGALKSHDKTMENLKAEIQEKEMEFMKAEKEVKDMKPGYFTDR